MVLFRHALPPSHPHHLPSRIYNCCKSVSVVFVWEPLIEGRDLVNSKTTSTTTVLQPISFWSGVAFLWMLWRHQAVASRGFFFLFCLVVQPLKDYIDMYSSNPSLPQASVCFLTVLKVSRWNVMPSVQLNLKWLCHSATYWVMGYRVSITSQGRLDTT